MAANSTPSVEERLMWAGQNVALLARLHHVEALAAGAELDTSTSYQMNAAASWCALRLSEEALAHIKAVERVDGDCLRRAAPDVKEAA